MKYSRLIGNGLLLMTLFGQTATASFLHYDNEIDFSNATAGTVMSHESFELTDKERTNLCGERCSRSERQRGSYDFGGVNVAAADSAIFRIETAAKDQGRFLSDGNYSVTAGPGGYLDRKGNGDDVQWGEVTFTFKESINALRFDLLDPSTVTGKRTALSVTTDSGSSKTIWDDMGASITEKKLAFAGFFSTKGYFRSFTLGFACEKSETSDPCATDDLVAIDNMFFGKVSVPVPEPGSFLLMFFSLLALTVSRGSSLFSFKPVGKV